MNRVGPSRRGQAGFVLANTLILIAALSLVALQTLQGSERSRRSVTIARSSSQLDMLGDAGVAYAAALLRQDSRANDFDHLEETWALDGHIIETALGAVRVSIRDMQGRVNINLLAVDGTGTVASLLEDILGDAGFPQETAGEVIGRFEQPSSTGAGVTGPSAGDRFRQRDIVRLSELASVPGVEPAILAQLGDRLTALPRGRGINVNTAGSATLSALLGNRPEQVAAVLATRERRPFKDVASFREFVGGVSESEMSLPLQALTVQSFWFEVRTEARIGDDVKRTLTILVRDTSTAEVSTFVKMVDVVR